MARGWESKSVQSQIEDRRVAREQTKRTPPDDEAEQERKRSSLELSRRRVMHDLETAQTDVHRTALQNALSYLDGELAKLKG